MKIKKKRSNYQTVLDGKFKWIEDFYMKLCHKHNLDYFDLAEFILAGC